jgi:signal transduction histidine kinase
MLAGAHPCLPRHPTAAVRPAAAVMKAVEQKRYRRQVMLYGEASLLFLLIGVCTFMLYQIVSQEHRFRHRMEDFVAAVTHEMKTPLTGIKSLLQTVVARKVPGAELPRLCGMGLKESERLEHMVENVLLAGRLRVEELRLVPEPLSLRPFLERFLEHRRQYLPDRPERLKLAWDLSELEASVRADPRALSTILENLTDNAFKYGGEEPDVTVRVSREGTRIYLAVEDTGVGFEAQAAPELFRPFHREWSDSQAVSHGAGLGLAIAAALAARMDAELAASSEGPGRGSRFTVKCREIRT